MDRTQRHRQHRSVRRSDMARSLSRCYDASARMTEVRAADHHRSRLIDERSMTDIPSTESVSRRTARTVGATTMLCIDLAACSSNGTETGRAAAWASSATAVAARPATTGAALHGSGRSADPCTLLTTAEAASVLGGPATHKPDTPKVVAGGNGLDVTANTCAFSTVTHSGDEVRIAVGAGANRSYFDSHTRHADRAPIMAVGDAAFGSPTDFYVFSRNTRLEVYGRLPAHGMQQVARLAIAKL